MADDSDWTVLTGWRKAAVGIPIRTFISSAIAWGAFWLLRCLVTSLGASPESEEETVGLGIVLVIGAVTGAVTGAVMGAKLAEATGLVGIHLIAPVYAVFVVGIYLVHCTTAWTGPEWMIISGWFYASCGLVTCIMAGATLLVDS